MKVPAVNLADPSVEPTDEELDALSMAALETALERRRIAEARFDAEMGALLEEGRPKWREAAECADIEKRRNDPQA